MHPNLRPVFFLLLLSATLFVSRCITPHRKFEAFTPPPVPDYSLETSWAALPWKKDSADALPSRTLKDEQANAKVDVFYVHPTVYFKGKSWNADLSDEKTNHLVDKYPVRHQASLFNGSCRVFAPRYRQATYASFIDNSGNGRKALDTAYTDVKKAFRYYLDHFNQGRPFIIAGHSQGSYHAQRLLRDFIDNDPELRKRFVAAYLVGGTAARNMYANIPASDSASQTGCYIAWHSRRWNSPIPPRSDKSRYWPGYDNLENYYCINPLTWRCDTTYAPASLNHGSVPKTFDRIDVGIVDAKISEQNIIWSHAPSRDDYIKGENYHVLDYNLFWMNFRENVELRVRTFLSGRN
jgi:hypothetical protein